MSNIQSTPTREKHRAGKPSAASAARTIECRYCHQWEVAAEDTYCSFCGTLQLDLEVQPKDVVLISVLAPQKELTFRNNSPQLLQAALVPRTGPKFQALTFEPADSFEIPPGEEVRIHAKLVADQLPAGFRERELDYVCLVNNDPRKQFRMRITARSGPRPQVSPLTLEFGDVQEGKTVERMLEVVNSGSIPLNVREIRVEGSSHLRLRDSFAPSVLHAGQKLSVSILWDSDVARTEGDSGDVGVRLTFGNYPESLFVRASARTFRYLLAVQPNLLSFPQVLAKQDYSAGVRLENRGTTDIEIESIEPSEPWIEVITRARRFTLLCAEPVDQRPREVSPTKFVGIHDFKVVCHPQELPAGKHQGSVLVRPLGQEPKSLVVEVDVVKPRPYPDYVGIDFGTTNSVVAVFNQKTYEIELVEDGQPPKRSPLIPSVLVFEDAETYMIGQSARNAMGAEPDRFVRSIKRIMGHNDTREFFGRTFSPEELANRIIRKLVQLAEQRLFVDTDVYFDVRKAIMTVPANFFDLQIRSVLEAATRAGLDTEDEKVLQAARAMQESVGQAVNAGIILDEPSAAVLYYIYYVSKDGPSSPIIKAVDSKEGLRLLVFDYGGGTLDVSVAHVTRLPSGEAGIRILANMGDNGIGGDSIDLILMREILRRCKEQVQAFDFDTSLIGLNFKEITARRNQESWSKDVWREILRVRMEWKNRSEAAKIQFSDRQRKNADIVILPADIVEVVDGAVRNAPREVKLSIPRQVLEDLLQTTLAKCKLLVDSALELAPLEHSQIDYILHTGRQSLLPLIQDRVRENFPDLAEDRVILEEDLIKVCVAKGAALYGLMRDKLGDAKARILLLSEGRRLPHSYGVEKFSNFRAEFDEIIPRGSSHPTVQTKEYPPDMIPSSGFLNLKFFQNTGSRKAIAGNKEVSLIGQISFDTLENGHPGCVVRFVIDANRKLEVFADDKAVEIQAARLEGEEGWIG